jgi:ABC-type glycerol-3-phosphate transport system permease component
MSSVKSPNRVTQSSWHPHTGPGKATVEVMDRLQSTTRYIVLIGAAILFLAPFLWLISTSLKTNDQIVQGSASWIPRPLTLQNYANAFTSVPLLRYGKNTLIVAFFSVVEHSSRTPSLLTAFRAWSGGPANCSFLLLSRPSCSRFKSLWSPYS